MVTTYLIVRHGEAVGNREHRFIGQSDVPLSDLGERQAAEVCRRLAGQPITAIISSDLARCADTVAPLSHRLAIPIDTDIRLREIRNGEWSNLLPEEIQERWPDIWQRYRDGEDVARPGGERWADVQVRVVAALEEDAARREDGDVVVVSTHGGPAQALILWAVGQQIDTLFRGPFGPVANASVTTLVLPSRRLLGVNDVGHLEVGGL